MVLNSPDIFQAFCIENQVPHSNICSCCELVLSLCKVVYSEPNPKSFFGHQSFLRTWKTRGHRYQGSK